MTTTLSRISTYTLHQSTLQNAARVQATLSDLQGQLSSGLKSRSYEGIADQAEQFMLIEAKISKTESYQNSNRVAESRINATDTILGQIIDTATSLKNLVLQRRNDAVAGSIAFPEQIDGLWKTLVGQLNTTLEGRYIFGGTRTDSPPLSDSVFPITLQPGVVDDGYYRGSKEDITLRIDDNIDVKYNVRADAPGLQKIFAGLSAAKTGDEENDPELLRRAYDLLQAGVDEVISTRAGVNANKVLLNQVTERQISLQVYWKGIKEDISNADLISASTQVAINQGILQASFQAFAKINSLRLVDYLR